MATYTKEFLSGSTNGKNVKVAATSTPGTTIHTCPAGTASKDEVWIFATNTATTAKKLTIEWGGTSSPDDLLEITVPPEAGDVLVIAGKILNNALVVKAFCETADVVNLSGYVNRIA